MLKFVKSTTLVLVFFFFSKFMTNKLYTQEPILKSKIIKFERKKINKNYRNINMSLTDFLCNTTI